MSRRLLALGCTLLGLGVWAGQTYAASGDADGTYTVPITRIEVSKDGGATFTTVFSGSTDINIAAANAGAVAAGLVSGKAIEPGTYNRVRVTIGDTLRVRGYVNSAGGNFFTNGQSDAAGFTFAAGTPDVPGGTYAISSFAIPAGNRVSTQTVSIVVPEKGAAGTCRVAFDTSGVLTAPGGLPQLGPPTVTVTSG